MSCGDKRKIANLKTSVHQKKKKKYNRRVTFQYRVARGEREQSGRGAHRVCKVMKLARFTRDINAKVSRKSSGCAQALAAVLLPLASYAKMHAYGFGAGGRGEDARGPNAAPMRGRK